jgi:hypothetical protein
MESQAQRQRIEPERQPSSLLLAPPPRNKRRMVFVLANPRSGSTLTQLMLNANPNLFAPQELYLLHFYTMGERRRRLAGQELEGWIFEGLRKAVMELRECEAAAADATLAELDTLDTQQVYDVLQGWAGERILVDKTPPYVWSLDTLRRAEAIFEDARYIFLYRHPYANVASMAKETIKREWLSDSLDGMMGTGPSALDAGPPGAAHSTILAAVEEAEAAASVATTSGAVTVPPSPPLDSSPASPSARSDGGSEEQAAPSALAPPVHATAAALAKARASKGRTQDAIERALWDEAENLWALGNANAMDFLQEVPSERTLSLAYEDLVTLPEASARALCKLVGVQYVADMANPYTERNMASFAPATEGGLGAGDPHMLKRKGIDPGVADAWRAAAPPRALTPFSAHVAKRLGYRLPMWKEPAARVGTSADIVRLNAHTAGPVVILVHDTSGEAHALRPLAAALPCAAFGIRATPSYGADGAAAILPDADIPALAARYRAAAAKALGLTAGDSVVYGGAGPLGARVAFEMAAQQQRATAATTTAAAAAAMAATATGSSPAKALTKVLATAGAAGRTWETAATAGEAAVVGLLLVDGTVSGQPDLPLPVDLYALYAVARDEVNARYTAPDADGIEAADGAKAATSYSAAKVATKLSEEEAAAAADAAAAAAAAAQGVTIAAFAAGLRAAGGRTSPEAALDFAGSFRHRGEGEGGGVGDDETPQREWDERVDRALRATRRGLQLAGKYASAANASAAAAAAGSSGAGTSNAVPSSVSFDGAVLLVTGAGVSAAAASTTHAAMRARATGHCPRLSAAARPGWGDPLAPAHAADLAELIAKELLQVKV